MPTRRSRRSRRTTSTACCSIRICPACRASSSREQLRDGGKLVPIVFVTGRQDEELLEPRSTPASPTSSRRAICRRAGSACGSSSRFASAAPRRSRRSSLDRANDGRARARRDPRGRLARPARPAARDQPRDRGAARRGPAARRRATSARSSAHRARAERLIADLLEASAIENGALHADARADRRRRRSCARPPPTTSCSRRRAAARSPRMSPTSRSSCTPIAIASSRCSAT